VTSATAPRRAGDTIALPVLILGSLPLGEKDSIVRLISAEEGKISAVAKGAQSSKRRFGASLDPGNFGTAHLVVPRDPEGGGVALWRLDRVDLRESFPHLRSSYYRLDCGLFAVALIRDLVPEGLGDPSFFRGLGRFLRDASFPELEKLGKLPRIAFWLWAAHHLGYGDFAAEILKSGAWSEIERAAWSHGLGVQVPDFAKLWTFFADRGKSLSAAQEIAVYRKWVEITGLSWPHFERCVGFLSSSSPSY